MIEVFLIDFYIHLLLLPWLQRERILLFEFHYLKVILDEVDEVNEPVLRLQIGFKKVVSEMVECAIQ